METPEELVRAVLSGIQPQPRESTQPSKQEEKPSPKLEPRLEAFQAESLGGMRALKTYTAELFKSNGTTKAALDACLGFDAGKHNLYLHGPCGSGKSHLAAIAARKYLGSPQKIMTLSPMKLYRGLRECDGAYAEREYIKSVSLCPVLVLDDLGAAKDSEFSIATTLEVIHERYMNLPGGLIITSNLGLDALSEKLGDERVSSRLVQICGVFNLSGSEDWRGK